MRNHKTELGETALTKDDDRQKWNTLFCNTTIKTCHHKHIKNKSARNQPSCGSFLQFDNSVSITDLHRVTGIMTGECWSARVPEGKNCSLNEEPSWHLPGGKEDKHIHLRMVMSQPRFNRPLQIQVYRIAATPACLVSCSVHTFVKYIYKINLCKETFVNLFHLSFKITVPHGMYSNTWYIYIYIYIYIHIERERESKTLLRLSFCKNSINQVYWG